MPALSIMQKNSIIQETDLSSQAEGDNFLFVSFDLMSSTKFKNLNPSWPSVILKFYAISVDNIQAQNHKFRIWKYAGDEVLFYLPISELSDLNEILRKVHLALNYTIDSVRKLEYSHIFLLSVKGTTWFASGVRQMDDKNPVDDHYRNFLTKLGGITDFIGVDIDIGFRISGYSSSSIVAVSDQLVYYLYRMKKENRIKEEIEKHLKIVGFAELKGVWLGRHYPIIWYHQNWDEVKKKSPYDERFHSELLQNVLTEKEDIHFNDISMIKNILVDVNLIKYYDSIYESLLGKNK